jgi:hypothetical protein
MSDVENIDDLMSEDNSYALQLQDLEYMIQLREEELLEMKATVTKLAELQSKLDSQLIAIEHMQNIIGNHQQKEIGFLKSFRRVRGIEKSNTCKVDSIVAKIRFFIVRTLPIK